ncbi:MAG: pitrilysin family protein [Bdellovibrionota bacterium]
MVKTLAIFSFIFSLQAFAIPNMETAKIVPGSSLEAYKYTLKNGLHLIVVPDTRNPVASLHFMLDAGSNREKLGTTGLAHFFEHNMFRKTVGAPEGNYDRVLNSVGGSGNAGTGDAFVTFYSKFPAPAIETMLKLEADRFMHLDITDPYFSTEKGAVISERKLRVENDPMQRSQEVLRSITERGTPMQWMTIGSKSDVENMSLNAAKQFYKEFYTPDNTLIVLGGPFKPQQAFELVEKYFSSWRSGRTPKQEPYPANYYVRDLGKSFICSAPVFTKRYQIVYPSAQSDLTTLVYTSLFEAMLNDNIEGTFSRRLVKAKLATEFNFYQVYWQDQTHPYIANFYLGREQDFEKVKAFWLKNVATVLNTPVTNKIKNQVLKQMAVSNADATERMTSLVNVAIDNDFFLRDFHAAGKAEDILKNLNEKKFKEWMKKNLNEKNFYMTGIVPTGATTPCSEYKEPL